MSLKVVTLSIGVILLSVCFSEVIMADNSDPLLSEYYSKMFSIMDTLKQLDKYPIIFQLGGIYQLMDSTRTTEVINVYDMKDLFNGTEDIKLYRCTQREITDEFEIVDNKVMPVVIYHEYFFINFNHSEVNDYTDKIINKLSGSNVTDLFVFIPNVEMSLAEMTAISRIVENSNLKGLKFINEKDKVMMEIRIDDTSRTRLTNRTLISDQKDNPDKSSWKILNDINFIGLYFNHFHSTKNQLEILMKNIIKSNVEQISFHEFLDDDEILIDVLVEYLPKSNISTLKITYDHGLYKMRNYEKLFDVLPLTKINVLDISGNYRLESNSNNLFRVLNNTKITDLNIEYCGFNQESFKMIAEVLCQTKVIHFYFLDGNDDIYDPQILDQINECLDKNRREYVKQRKNDEMIAE